MKGFGSLKPQTGSSDSVRLNEVIDMFSFPADEDVSLRFLPTDILPVKQHWIKILAGKDKREVKIPRYCIAFNPENEAEPLEGVECPYCTISSGKDGACQTSTFYLANAIIREIQEDEPRKKVPANKKEKATGYKDINSKSWTPVRVVRLTATSASRLQELGNRNKVKGKSGTRSFDVDHPKFGKDIVIKFKPKAAGSDKWSVDAEDRTPLTEEEQEYLTWELDTKLLKVTGLLTQEQAEKDFARMEVAGSEIIEDQDDEEGVSMGSLYDDDDDDDDEAPRRSRSKRKPTRKAKTSDAFDEDDDDEEEAPRRTKRKTRKPTGDTEGRTRRKKTSEEPTRRKKAPAKKAVEDDDDDWLDGDDEAPAKKPARRKKTSSGTARKKRTRTEQF